VVSPLRADLAAKCLRDFLDFAHILLIECAQVPRYTPRGARPRMRIVQPLHIGLICCQQLFNAASYTRRTASLGDPPHPAIARYNIRRNVDSIVNAARVPHKSIYPVLHHQEFRRVLRRTVQNEVRM
jgi:hypothetical protein